jgi:hypothetical protein
MTETAGLERDAAAAEPIPILLVMGDHHQVGRQVGEASAEVLRRAVAFDGPIPEGRSLDEQLALASRYREATRAATPWLVEEIDGAAEGAGVDALALFAASIEEIWTVRPSQATAPVAGRCTDLVAGPPLTVDGHVIVGHDNDLSPRAEAEVLAIEWRVPGEPAVFSLGIGPWISVGWNDAGLSLTGNELSPNDERVGVPRLLMVREQLTARTMGEAIGSALRPDRASSYNTIFATADGGVANVEGSATDAEVDGLGSGGWLAHANHYACARMARFEGDPAYALRSAVRHARAAELLAAAAPGSVDLAAMRGFIADHATEPAICRHDASGDGSKTVFWCVADVTAGEIRFGRGNPCRPGEQRWSFA